MLIKSALTFILAPTHFFTPSHFELYYWKIKGNRLKSLKNVGLLSHEMKHQNFSAAKDAVCSRQLSRRFKRFLKGS